MCGFFKKFIKTGIGLASKHLMNFANSVIVDCDIQWINELTGIVYDSYKNILSISLEFDSDAYELVIIFNETTGEKHFVRILH